MRLPPTVPAVRMRMLPIVRHAAARSGRWARTSALDSMPACVTAAPMNSAPSRSEISVRASSPPSGTTDSVDSPCRKRWAMSMPPACAHAPLATLAAASASDSGRNSVNGSMPRWLREISPLDDESCAASGSTVIAACLDVGWLQESSSVRRGHLNWRHERHRHRSECLAVHPDQLRASRIHGCLERTGEVVRR